MTIALASLPGKVTAHSPACRRRSIRSPGGFTPFRRNSITPLGLMPFRGRVVTMRGLTSFRGNPVTTLCFTRSRRSIVLTHVFSEAPFALCVGQTSPAFRAFLGHAHRLEPVSYTHLRAHETDSYLVC